MTIQSMHKQRHHVYSLATVFSDLICNLCELTLEYCLLFVIRDNIILVYLCMYNVYMRSKTFQFDHLKETRVWMNTTIFEQLPAEFQSSSRSDRSSLRAPPACMGTLRMSLHNTPFCA